MKCRIQIFLFIITCLIFFTSCNTRDETFDIDTYKKDYSYGLQVFDMSMEMLPNAIDEYSPYKNRIIKFYNLTDTKTDYTFFVTLNGSLCPIKVDGNHTVVSYNNSAEANSITEMEVNIQLKEDQLLPEINYLVFTIITENQIVNVQNTDMIFNKVSFANELVVPDTIHVTPPTIAINEDEYQFKSNEIIERYRSFQFATLQDIETKRYEMISNRSLQFNSDERKIRIEAVGDKGLYSLLLFSNDKPIHLSGSEYNYIFMLNGNDMLSKEIELTTDDTEGSLYALIFPLENENYMPFLTNKAAFETTQRSE